jgi:hypothetical protein
VSGILQMDPDLVRASGLKSHGKQIGCDESLEAPDMCHRWSPIRDDGHAFPILWMAPHRSVNRHMVSLDPTPARREISATDPAGSDIGRQRTMCDLVLGDHHQTTRIPIETVNDARTKWRADRRQSVGPGQESVDERTGRVTRRRVNNQTRRFVDDEEKLVFV